MSDSSGQINLRGLGEKNGSASMFTIPGHDAWLYKYNPCYEFSFGFYYGLAVSLCSLSLWLADEPISNENKIWLIDVHAQVNPIWNLKFRQWFLHLSPIFFWGSIHKQFTRLCNELHVYDDMVLFISVSKYSVSFCRHFYQFIIQWKECNVFNGRSWNDFVTVNRSNCHHATMANLSILSIHTLHKCTSFSFIHMAYNPLPLHPVRNQ